MLYNSYEASTNPFNPGRHKDLDTLEEELRRYVFLIEDSIQMPQYKEGQKVRYKPGGWPALSYYLSAHYNMAQDL